MIITLVKKLVRVLFYLIPSFIRKPLRAYINDKKQLKMRFPSNPKDYNQRIFNREKGNLIIKDIFLKNEPFMVARIGETELKCCNYYLQYRNNKQNQLGFTEELLNEAYLISGVYPKSNELFDEFCEIYLNSIKNTDIMGVWHIEGEHIACNEYCPDAKLVPLSSISPILFKNPWSEQLRNKKVLVISPFAELINSQYQKREFLFENKKILPEFELITYKAVQAMGGGNNEYASWIVAYESMCNDIKKLDFDIALVGAGAFGLPLASFIKSINKQVVHVGGALQLLFGIKGGRWDNIKEYRENLYNDYWVRPSMNETPENLDKIASYEGIKAYW